MTESNTLSLQSNLPGVCAYLICLPCIAAMVEPGSTFLPGDFFARGLFINSPAILMQRPHRNEWVCLSHSANVGLNKPLSSIFNHSTSSSLHVLATVAKVRAAQVQSSTDINFTQNAALWSVPRISIQDAREQKQITYTITEHPKYVVPQLCKQHFTWKRYNV